MENIETAMNRPRTTIHRFSGSYTTSQQTEVAKKVSHSLESTDWKSWRTTLHEINAAIAFLQKTMHLLRRMHDGTRQCIDVAQRLQEEESKDLSAQYQQTVDGISQIAQCLEAMSDLSLPRDSEEQRGEDAEVRDLILRIANCLPKRCLFDAPKCIDHHTQAADAQIKLRAAQAEQENVMGTLKELEEKLSQAVARLTAQSHNMQAAESRSADIDVANDMAIFVAQQILTKPFQAVRTQAQPLSKMVLPLIQ
ncbi:MAG: hypothetical protein IJS54_04830 [Desulfovibrio sp.]|nr:hypothetical protein [Desulfovibrio sp.]